MGAHSFGNSYVMVLNLSWMSQILNAGQLAVHSAVNCISKRLLE